MTINLSALYSISKEYIEDKINFLIKLGYSKENIIKITITFPSLYSFSNQNIQDKFDFLKSLGYTKEEVLKITFNLPTLYGLSKENIEDKVIFLRSVDLGFVILEDTKVLMQSTKLVYARYEFLTKEKEIKIGKNNYKKIYYSNQAFCRKYNVTKEELLEKYDYELIKIYNFKQAKGEGYGKKHSVIN